MPLRTTWEFEWILDFLRRVFDWFLMFPLSFLWCLLLYFPAKNLRHRRAYSRSFMIPSWPWNSGTMTRSPAHMAFDTHETCILMIFNVMSFCTVCQVMPLVNCNKLFHLSSSHELCWPPIFGLSDSGLLNSLPSLTGQVKSAQSSLLSLLCLTFHHFPKSFEPLGFSNVKTGSCRDLSGKACGPRAGRSRRSPRGPGGQLRFNMAGY